MLLMLKEGNFFVKLPQGFKAPRLMPGSIEANLLRLYTFLLRRFLTNAADMVLVT